MVEGNEDKHGRRKSRTFSVGYDSEVKEDQSCLQRFVRGCQYGVIGSLERFFKWYGELIATHPKKAILGCFIVTLIGGSGLLRFYEEGDAASIVIPRHSEFRQNIDWLDDNFPREVRVHSIVFEAENVLTPAVIKVIYEQRKKLETLVSGGKTFQDMCIQVPILKLPNSGFISGDLGQMSDDSSEEDEWGKEFEEFDKEFEESDGSSIFGLDGGTNSKVAGLVEKEVDVALLESWSNLFYPEPYCSAVRGTETACYELNIVELWGDQGFYSAVSDLKMDSLTQTEILDTINSKNISQIFLKEKNFKELLGDIKYNAKGEIIGAGAVEMKFYTTVNISAVKQYGTVSRGEKIDQVSYDFEGMMIDMFTNRENFPEHISSYVNIQRQFFESFVGQTFKDADKLVLGYMLVFLYVNIMLSKLNCIEQRIWLSVVGILSVAMGMVLGYGLCSMFGLFYSAAHTVIPFLLLGIGIDNIFVITQAYNTLLATETPLSLEKRFGQTMGHAGVAVSVTTFTDVIAFFVGSNTLLPGLESFCIYAAVAIFAIYCLQVTHFVAWFSLDERRVRSHRNGCLCCVKHKQFKAYEFSKGSLLNKAFRFLGILITKSVFKILILILTFGILAFGVLGALNLTQEYQPEWLLPPESEIAQWFTAKKEYFPSAGEPGFVMIPQIDIPAEFHKIDNLVLQLRNRTDNIEWVNTWHQDFRAYVEKFNYAKDFHEIIQDQQYFRNIFTQFLFSPKGAIYQANFWFSEKLECGQPSPDILLQAIPFAHKRFESSTVWVPAMEEVEQIVTDMEFSNYSFPIALTYINWKTDAIVGIELFRNISIALICIFVTTLCTLGSWRGSMFVMMCVLFTCIDVAGFMHWWGLTIDITSMSILIISVGLCVDFCAHIVHGFLAERGTRHERVVFVMENIAPAVINGGFSSILALSLLVTSKSHIFISFFKIFFMICVFGLFHGLVTLPVVLAIIGPQDKEDKQEVSEETKTLNPKLARTNLNDLEPISRTSWLRSTYRFKQENNLRSIQSDTNIVKMKALSEANKLWELNNNDNGFPAVKQHTRSSSDGRKVVKMKVADGERSTFPDDTISEGENLVPSSGSAAAAADGTRPPSPSAAGGLVTSIGDASAEEGDPTAGNAAFPYQWDLAGAKESQL